MMGMMSPEQLLQIAEAQRKQAEEAAEAGTQASPSQPAGDPEFTFEENGVTEEMVMSYLASRKEVLERARYKMRMQSLEIDNLTNKLKLSEQKNQTLRTALAATREELNQVKAALAAQGTPA